MDSLQILLIEDDLLTATDIKQALQQAGHRILAIARTYTEAIAAVKQQWPDLIIADIRLEGSSADGIDTVEALLLRQPVPVIFLTANSEEETVSRTRLTRPAAFMLKPFRRRELVIQVELAYEQHQLIVQSVSVVSAPEPKILYLPIGKGYERIVPQEVLYLLADGSYVKLFQISDPKPRVLSMNLGALIPYFSAPNFYRLSRSILINLDHLGRVERNQLYLTTQQEPIDISENNRAELMKKLNVVRTRPA
ncbi:MAG: response regulator [Rudanella sp.]|nr:response regulator [Rudanella sp.]